MGPSVLGQQILFNLIMKNYCDKICYVSAQFIYFAQKEQSENDVGKPCYISLDKLDKF